MHIDSVHYHWKSIVNKEQCNHCQQKFGTIDELEAHIEKCNQKGSVSNISQVNDNVTSYLVIRVIACM